MSNEITHSTQLDKCLITGAPVVKVLDLGQHAYADTFISEDQLNLSEPVFPLHVYLCPESGHLQMRYVSDAEARYNLYNYSYTSSNSKFACNHWNEFAETVKKKFDTDGLVVEVGSNDGYLIKQFADTAQQVLGVDSSSAMCDIARNDGVETLCAVFSTDTADSIITEKGKAKIVIANNVLNHANNPVNFARAVSNLLTDDGRFIFEVPYWTWMATNGKFVDQVYHEHVSYFTVKSVWNLLLSVGMEIEYFDEVDYHGVSLRVVARKWTGEGMPMEVADTIEQEDYLGIFDPSFYSDLEKRLKHARNEWLANFYKLKVEEPDAVIIGVGAAAKANTWLNWHGLDSSMLDYITDASQHKQGKYTPLSRIPIRGDEEFANHKEPYALVLSWNIGEGLKNAILKINPNTRFISQ
jgi:SAM-dependent methyltransferase